MSSWIVEPRKFRRKKTSVYLREDIAERVDLLKEKRKMSFSEAVNRIMERGLGMDGSLQYR